MVYAGGLNLRSANKVSVGRRLVQVLAAQEPRSEQPEPCKRSASCRAYQIKAVSESWPFLYGPARRLEAITSKQGECSSWVVSVSFGLLCMRSPASSRNLQLAAGY
jgi:hypothetical protein